MSSEVPHGERLERQLKKRHRKLRLANFLFESPAPIEKDIGRLGIGLTTSQWLTRLKMLEITETEWTSVRNHLRSTSPEFFKRVKKDDAVVCCDSLRYTTHAFQPAAPAFLLVAVRNGMPKQRLIDTMHMIRAADQMRVSKAITALKRALVQSIFTVINAGHVGHAQHTGGRRSVSGNHKERRFRRNKRLQAQAQASAKRRRWQSGWQFRACVPADHP